MFEYKSKEIIDKVKNKSMDIDHITSIFRRKGGGTKNVF